MKLQSIEKLLETVCRFNYVKITQVFTRQDIDWVSVRCVPSTSTLELTYLTTGEVECFASVAEAAHAVHEQLRLQ
ncbi:hypothetical protein [Planococcus chinensis]|uniref:DUF1797 family protein n=1 Tax=Planococcus chinensis TaxID=272917 RepID=A0ABW4QIY5_9BACL